MRPWASRHYPWYDSRWLSDHADAVRLLQRESPRRVAEFERAFDVFRTDPAFEVRRLTSVFDDSTMDTVRRTCATLALDELEFHEVPRFRRFVVHDHALFDELQRRITGMASEAAGEALEPAYNFLSLYGHEGLCPLHMDAPQSKWTLDLCVSHSVPWPIHFSPVVDWPQPGDYGMDWEEAVKRQYAGRFTTLSLEPGEAVLFSGSNQWHYRDRMPNAAPGMKCDLLFFHFIPQGTKDLADPAQWARLFGEPSLAGLGGHGEMTESAG